MIPGKNYGPEDILRIVRRRIWLIVLPFVVVAAPTLLVTRALKNTYKSETLILVVPQRVPESYVRSTVTDRIADRLQSLSEQILSRPRLEKIIDEFDLYADKRKTMVMEDIVNGMREQDVAVAVVRGDAFRVSYVATKPSVAKEVVERLASLFIEENTREREGQAEGTNKFLESQMEDARRRLIEREEQLADYQRAHLNELPSQRNFNLQAQQSAEIQLQSLMESLSVDRDRRLVAERLIADASAPNADGRPSDATGAEDGKSSESRTAEQLEAAQTRLREMQLRLRPEHPDVIGQKKLITELEVKARGEATVDRRKPVAVAAPTQSPITAARERRVAEARLELANLNKKMQAKEDTEKRLRGEIATYQARIQSAPLRDAELAEMTRDYETIKGLYQSLLQKNEDSKLAANLERRQIGEQFKIIEPAKIPEKPFSPNRPRIAVIGAILGLVLGVGLTGLLEYLDTTMRSEQDVIGAIGVPVLALVYSVVTDHDRQRRRRARIWWGLSAAATAVLCLAGLAWKLKA